MGEVVEATRENFHDVTGDGLAMIDVWGPQCRPCMALMPHVARIAEERPELRVIKLEAPKARRICIELGVHGLPTFLLMRDGEELARLSAPELSPNQLRDWLAQQLEPEDADSQSEPSSASAGAGG